ncbi:uncharacterized protein LOC111012566 isoform X2 [Momordica charantia]|uniref:Uncharacterized protein LOC111012566 isoform X2 n=1 Tax=Momordica charantia TaxID=3673 RepID=A0A6J1CM57_MOMCH|nr:uncharacterized protein LOC111012566 isoform X2 [Momordica charantia]
MKVTWNLTRFLPSTDRGKILLREFALNGQWTYAKKLIDEAGQEKNLVRAKLTANGDTILHVAVKAQHTSFVKHLLHKMKPDDLIIRNKDGYTAFCFAAASGVTEIARLMVAMDKDLPSKCGSSDQKTPLLIAVLFKRRDMAHYLLSKTIFHELPVEEQVHIFNATLNSELYDISLEILESDVNYLATRKCKKKNGDHSGDDGETPFEVMARKPIGRDSWMPATSWKVRIVKAIKGLYKKDMTQEAATRLLQSLFEYASYFSTYEDVVKLISKPNLLHVAAKAGNAEFLVQVFRFFPEILWEKDVDATTILHIAIENRLEVVWKLLYDVGWLNDFLVKNTSENNNDIMYLVAKLAAPHHLNKVSGAALQMQRELIWFNEIEKVVPVSQLEAKCKDTKKEEHKELLVEVKCEDSKKSTPCTEEHEDLLRLDDNKKLMITSHQISSEEQKSKLTPRQLFTKEHKDLLTEGEKWMQNTANSCMVVSTLIATVVFAAAFTIPGNYDKTGTPIFQPNIWFTVFILSDATALISSSTSILIFLSILTSRYTEEDFLHSLPAKLILGLSSLFISIVCMFVTFSATFFLLYNKATISIPMMIGAMMMVPIPCFGALQFKLWIDIFQNTYL